MSHLMTTHEVAEYLRIKERKVYDLVRQKKIPCTRVTGKWLFPKPLIDQWVAGGTDFPEMARALAGPAPPVVAGSHDPLLEWAVRESGCGLAMMPGGSLDGLRRLTTGEAALAGLHVFDADSSTYNQTMIGKACDGLGVTLIEWAWRDQGLVLAPGNPLGIRSLADLGDTQARVVARQPEAGSRILFEHLLEEAGVDWGELNVVGDPALSENDLGLAVQEGKADVGLAVATVARHYRLDFLELHRERFDLVFRRRDYFEPPAQKLMEFTRTNAFRDKVAEMAGYDCSGLGRVVYNGT